jgi:hypothetical protein
LLSKKRIPKKASIKKIMRCEKQKHKIGHYAMMAVLLFFRKATRFTGGRLLEATSFFCILPSWC